MWRTSPSFLFIPRSVTMSVLSFNSRVLAKDQSINRSIFIRRNKQVQRDSSLVMDRIVRPKH